LLPGEAASSPVGCMTQTPRCAQGAFNGVTCSDVCGHCQCRRGCHRVVHDDAV